MRLWRPPGFSIMLGKGRDVSIATRVSVLLTAVISLVLFVGAVAYVLYQYQLESRHLEQSHQLTVKQLSLSLTLPMWNYDNDQTQKILLGAMQDPETFEVNLRDTRTGEILAGFGRDGLGAPVARVSHAQAPPRRSIISEQEILVDGQTIGVVHLETTRDLLWKRVIRWALSTLLAIFVLDIILITSIYLLFWRFVLSPLLDLERYATGIGTANEAPPLEHPQRFQGELLRLKESLGNMVTLLQERYRTLERQAGFNRWLALAMERFAIVENDQFETLFETLLGELALLLGADQAFWTDYDSGTRTWTVRAVAGLDRERTAGFLRVGIPQPGIEWSDGILLAGEVLRIPSVSKMPRPADGAPAGLPWEAVVITPLRITHQSSVQIRGAIGLTMLQEPKSWDAKEVQSLVLFGNAAGTARERHLTQVQMVAQSEKLAVAYDLQRLLFDQAFQFIGLLSPDGKLHRANQTALGFVGTTEAEVLGKPFWDTPWWSHDDAQKDILKECIHRAARGETVRFQSTHRAVDGLLHHVDFSIKPVTDRHGNLLWLMPEGRDINDIVETQRALAASEERYRSLFEHAGDAIILIKDGVYQDCNGKALEIFGGSREQILGKSPADFSPPTQADGEKSAVVAGHKMALSLAGQSQHFLWRHLRVDSTPFDAEVTLNLLRDGDTPLLQAIIRDVTLRRKQEEMNRRNAEALLQNDKLMALGELAAGMAHEITQPLSGISLALQGLGIRLRRGPLEAPAAESILEDVGGYVERIRRLIEHVRMFSRDRRTEAHSRFDARTSIEGVISLLGTQLRNHGIELATRLPADPIWVDGNLFELEQVFFNLFSNARYALDKRREQEGPGFKPRLSIEAAVGEDTCRLTLEDNGTGIPADKVRHLFEPFFTTKPVGEGTGLGLSISRGIIQGMNGDFTIESEAGAYTRIHITLPRPKDTLGSPPS